MADEPHQLPRSRVGVCPGAAASGDPGVGARPADHDAQRAPVQKLVKTAGVRPIKFHGLRHTCATLLLQAGVPVQVVAQRLGHAQISMMLEVYAHALPDMQKDAAAKLGALLAGR